MIPSGRKTEFLKELKDKQKGIDIEGLVAAEFGGTNLQLAEIARQPDQISARQKRVEFGLVDPDVDGGDGTTPTQKPMSTNQVEQFRRSYGWTPPFGFSQSQLLQFMNDNPGLTPEEYEEAAGSVGGQAEAVEETTESVTSFLKESLSEDELKILADKAGISSAFKFKSVDIKNYLESIQDAIQQAIDDGLTKEEILEILQE